MVTRAGRRRPGVWLGVFVLLAACGQQATPSGSAKPESTKQAQPPNEARAWGPIQTVIHDPAEWAIGVPAAVFDPVVGTLVVWPHNRGLDVRVKAPGRPWGDAHAITVAQDRGSYPTSVMVGTDGRGEATIAWIRASEDQAAKYPHQLVTATRSASGEWGEPELLWQRPYLDNMESGPVMGPHMATSADGSAVLAWTEEGLTDPRDEDSWFTQAWAAYRDTDGEWQDPVNLGDRRPDPAGSGSSVDDVAMDEHGVASIAVSKDHGLTLYQNDHGPFEAEHTVDGGTGELAVTPDGGIDLVFQSSAPAQVGAAHRTGEEWSEVIDLTEESRGRPGVVGGRHNNPSLAQHGRAATVVLASEYGPVQARTRDGDTYGPPVTIAPGITKRQVPRDVLGVWANESGQALAIWGPYGVGEPGAWVLEAAYRADGKWSAPVALSEGKSTSEDVLGQYVGVAAIVYENGGVAVWWSDDQHILARELGSAP